MSRLDYIEYDELAAAQQAEFKKAFKNIEALGELHLANGRAKALFVTNLEQAYMWIGKALRDQQLSRNENSMLQESRTNS